MCGAFEQQETCPDLIQLLNSFSPDVCCILFQFYIVAFCEKASSSSLSSISTSTSENLSASYIKFSASALSDYLRIFLELVSLVLILYTVALSFLLCFVASTFLSPRSVFFKKHKQTFTCAKCAVNFFALLFFHTFLSHSCSAFC